MPEALASDPSQTIFHYKGGISPPSSYTKWANLVTALVAGVVDRYGLEEVKQWGFEVWNERKWPLPSPSCLLAAGRGYPLRVCL